MVYLLRIMEFSIAFSLFFSNFMMNLATLYTGFLRYPKVECFYEAFHRPKWLK